MSSSSLKRARPNEEDEHEHGHEHGIEQNTHSYLIDKMLKLDTDQLVVSEGRNNAETTLVKLQKVCKRLQASIDAVKIEEKKIKEEETRKREEEKMKGRMICTHNKLCFECKKNVEDVSALSACCTYKHSEDGILVCNDCKDKFHKATCSECSAFLCNGESSCTDVYCCDDSIKCVSCEETTCLKCAENSSNTGKHCHDCYDWYCYTCVNEDDDQIMTDCCNMCDNGSNFCHKCECDHTYFKQCDGDCNEPLCDECVKKLACGNNVRLCGECEYECEDCDMCYENQSWLRSRFVSK